MARAWKLRGKGPIIVALYNSGKTPKEIADALGVSRRAVELFIAEKCEKSLSLKDGIEQPAEPVEAAAT